MTAEAHRSGTERLAEAIQKLALGADEIVVNVQGDEPLMPPAVMRRTAETLAAHVDAVVATVGCPIRDDAELHNPNVVKVVFDANGYALYFSACARSRSRAMTGGYRCGIVISGFTPIVRAMSRNYVALAPSPHEQAEQLEQLRVLWHGERIAVTVCDPECGPRSKRVDTSLDLDRVRKILATLKR